MAPSGSVPAGRLAYDGQNRTGNVNHNLPASLPRYEGFASTLGGFARSPQVSRALPSILRPTEEQEESLVSAGNSREQQRESAFVETLQAPLLFNEAADTDGNANQSFRPASLLARSLGTSNEVFSRQVGTLSKVTDHPASAQSSLSTCFTFRKLVATMLLNMKTLCQGVQPWVAAQQQVNGIIA